MSRNVRDLTAAEIDKLARDAWSDAARRALDLGLPVSGSRNGRRFRYHPDGRIEDLGPVVETRATGSASALPNVDLPELYFQGDELPAAYREMAEVGLFQAKDAYERATKFEVPEQMRAFAEKGVSQARDSYAEFKQAVETHNNAVEAVLATASRGAAEYSTKLTEFMKDNAAATVEFAQELLAVKSPFGALELWNSHTRKQVQTLTAQAKELAELVRRTGAEAQANNVSNNGHP
jgi:phasin